MEGVSLFAFHFSSVYLHYEFVVHFRVWFTLMHISISPAHSFLSIHIMPKIKEQIFHGGGVNFKQIGSSCILFEIYSLSSV